MDSAILIDKFPHAKVCHVPLSHFTVKITKLPSSILASVHPRDEWTTGVMVFPFANIVNLAADNHPTILKGTVLRDFCARYFSLAI